MVILLLKRLKDLIKYISDNGKRFTWSWQEMDTDSWTGSNLIRFRFDFQLKNANVSTDATIRSGGMGWQADRVKSSGQCKLIKTETVTAKVKTTSAKPLEAFFLEQESYDRRNIQLALSDLGFYKSKIDGFYGPSTERALKEYNNEYLGAADLGKRYNVSALFKDILTPQIVEAEEKQPMPESEPTPKLDMVQIQASYDAKDYRRAFADAQVLAVQGDTEAQLLLGKMFADGEAQFKLRQWRICGST